MCITCYTLVYHFVALRYMLQPCDTSFRDFISLSLSSMRLDQPSPCARAAVRHRAIITNLPESTLTELPCLV